LNEGADLKRNARDGKSLCLVEQRLYLQF